jgi:hypothetical protein
MILPFATVEAVLKALYNGTSRPDIPEEEVEFTPFDLSYLYLR